MFCKDYLYIEVFSGDSRVHIAVAECTSVKEEIIEDNMDTEDPLSVQGRS